ncbi:hypothetical protein FA95DRAFT_1411573, partial [Auriscalpium vulgare]
MEECCANTSRKVDKDQFCRVRLPAHVLHLSTYVDLERSALLAFHRDIVFQTNYSTSMNPPRDSESDQTANRTPDPPDSQRSRAEAVIGDVQGGPVPRRIDRLTESTDIVIRAQGLPRLKNLLGRERPFFLGITDGVKTKRTQAARRKEQYVAWTFML